MDIINQTCVLNEILTCVTCPVILEEPAVTDTCGAAGITSGIGNTGVRVGGVTCLTGVDPCVTETKQCSGVLSVTTLQFPNSWPSVLLLSVVVVVFSN